MIRITPIIIVYLFLSACTSTVSFTALRPAQIDVPNRIKNVALVNRTLPDSRRDKAWNVMEGVFSGEGFEQDYITAPHSIKGCQEAINENPRFKAVAYNRTLIGTGTREIPSPLPWDTVLKICRESNSQALIVLESFDSDFQKSLRIDTVRVKDKKGNVQKRVETTTVKQLQLYTGWRLYDPLNKNIFDESNLFADSRTDKPGYEGINLYDREKRDMALSLANNIGVDYAFRISPNWVRLYRSYYIKGCAELETAARYVTTNDWTGAAKIWQSLLNNPKKKIRKRAAYNMIVANEILGKLDIAREWATKNYKEFGKSEFRTYIRTLDGRIRNEERLKTQLGEEYTAINK